MMMPGPGAPGPGPAPLHHESRPARSAPSSRIGLLATQETHITHPIGGHRTKARMMQKMHHYCQPPEMGVRWS